CRWRRPAGAARPAWIGSSCCRTTSTWTSATSTGCTSRSCGWTCGPCSSLTGTTRSATCRCFGKWRNTPTTTPPSPRSKACCKHRICREHRRTRPHKNKQSCPGGSFFSFPWPASRCLPSMRFLVGGQRPFQRAENFDDRPVVGPEIPERSAGSRVDVHRRLDRRQPDHRDRDVLDAAKRRPLLDNDLADVRRFV